MKKKLLFLLCSILSITMIEAGVSINTNLGVSGTRISVEQLPAKGRALIKTHFSGLQVYEVEQNWYSYKIRLEEGIKIKISEDGDWLQIEKKYHGALPNSLLKLLPNEANEYIRNKFSELRLYNIKRKRYGGYKVKLRKEYYKVKIEFSDSGRVLDISY